MAVVLVTGARGFVGRPLVRQLLEQGHEVHAVTSAASDADNAVHWHQCDLLDLAQVAELCRQVQARQLVHLAWCAKPGSYWTSPDNLRWVGATLQLLEQFRLHGGDAAVVAGTCAEYDWRTGFMQEAFTPLQPTTVYGRCKRSCSELAGVFSQLHDMPVAWGRIFQAYGPHEAAGRLLPSVIAALSQGQEAHCSHGQQLRDFIHVDDVASALLHLLAARASGAFNIGNGLPQRLAEAVEYVADRLGRANLLRLGSVAVSPEEPPLLVADVRKLKALGWRGRFDLHDGLDDTLAWWQCQG